MDSQEFYFRFQCGVGEPAASTTLDDRQRIVDAFYLHYCIFAMLTELDQVKQGLMVQKFNVLMEKYPNVVRTAFQPVKEVITSSLIEELYCSHTTLAPMGSERWSKQQAIINPWVCYLRRIKGMARLEIVHELHVYKHVFVLFKIQTKPMQFHPCTMFLSFQQDVVVCLLLELMWSQASHLMTSNEGSL